MGFPPAVQASQPPVHGAPWWAGKGAPPLEALGEVSFARLGTPYIAETFHADSAALRRLRLQGRAAVWQALAQGRVASACRIRFLVSLSADRRRAFFLRTLPRTWPGPGFSPERPEVKAFLELVCRHLEPGDRQEYLFLPGRGLWVRMGDGAPVFFAEGPLVAAIRTIEWEEDPETPGTMAGLLQAYVDRLR